MSRLSTRAFLALAAAVVFAIPTAHAGTWQIDPVHSYIGYKTSHLTVGKHYGFIREFAGTIEFDPEAIEDASIEVTAQAASLDSLHPGRDEHLRTADFFNATEFATISFVSSQWEDAGENAYHVTGTLSLLGVEREVTVPVQFNGTAQDRRDQTVAGFEGTAIIKRSDFGMNFGLDSIGDEVTLILAFEAILQEDAE